MHEIQDGYGSPRPRSARRRAASWLRHREIDPGRIGSDVQPPGKPALPIAPPAPREWLDPRRMATVRVRTGAKGLHAYRSRPCGTGEAPGRIRKVHVYGGQPVA